MRQMLFGTRSGLRSVWQPCVATVLYRSMEQRLRGQLSVAPFNGPRARSSSQCSLNPANGELITNFTNDTGRSIRELAWDPDTSTLYALDTAAGMPPPGRRCPRRPLESGVLIAVRQVTPAPWRSRQPPGGCPRPSRQPRTGSALPRNRWVSPWPHTGSWLVWSGCLRRQPATWPMRMSAILKTPNAISASPVSQPMLEWSLVLLFW